MLYKVTRGSKSRIVLVVGDDESTYHDKLADMLSLKDEAGNVITAATAAITNKASDEVKFQEILDGKIAIDADWNEIPGPKAGA